ncbi:MAG: lysophospholipid acyltransferase family protein [Deltaproteobacteria bacterium]|nr:lysophospholipid acyltransferase family protein [Deltaproteobacteria bacterium]
MTIHTSETPSTTRQPLPHEGLFWRRLAHWGASKGPEWWVRYSPPVFGWAAAALVPSARRAVRKNLHRIRGPAPAPLDARDVLRTFSNYASCLAEVLSNDAEGGPRQPFATIWRSDYLADARARGKGVIMVTAHTAGWEAVGPLFAAHHGLEMMIVMQPEPDERARALHDQARRRAGVTIVHVGDDPLASLPLLRHLRGNGALALQLDRLPPGMRTHDVTLLGEPARIPEGPLRLAQVSGAAILPVFCARVGYRRYAIVMYPWRTLSRHAPKEEVDAAAQHLAECMSDFLRSHPTQWFHWDER